MLTKEKIAASLLGLAAGVISLSAQAATVASASASLGNFSYQLIDLDLADGIAPSLTFVPSRGGDGYVHSPLNGGRHLYGNGAASISSANGNASATVAPMALSSSAQAILPTGNNDNFSSFTSEVRNFSLSANTLVIFSISAHLSANHVPDSAYTSANVVFRGTLDSSWYDPNRNGSNFMRYANSPLDTTTDSDFVFAGSLHSVGYTTLGQLGMNTRTSATLFPGMAPQGIQAVPEPSTYAMLFAGLGLVGFAARRRRGAGR
jgi:hypothetical protein